MRGRRNPERPPDNPLLPPCRVCGEKGTGFHYGVTTCGACKGFFRRSIVRVSPYPCLNSHMCQVGPSTTRRQTCPKCRYDKCTAVGMSRNACKVGRYSLDKKSKDIAEMLKHHMDSGEYFPNGIDISMDHPSLHGEEYNYIASNQSTIHSHSIDTQIDPRVYTFFKGHCEAYYVSSHAINDETGQYFGDSGLSSHPPCSPDSIAYSSLHSVHRSNRSSFEFSDFDRRSDIPSIMSNYNHYNDPNYLAERSSPVSSSVHNNSFVSSANHRRDRMESSEYHMRSEMLTSPNSIDVTSLKAAHRRDSHQTMEYEGYPGMLTSPDIVDMTSLKNFTQRKDSLEHIEHDNRQDMPNLSPFTSHKAILGSSSFIQDSSLDITDHKRRRSEPPLIQMPTYSEQEHRQTNDFHPVINHHHGYSERYGVYSEEKTCRICSHSDFEKETHQINSHHTCKENSRVATDTHNPGTEKTTTCLSDNVTHVNHRLQKVIEIDSFHNGQTYDSEASPHRSKESMTHLNLSSQPSFRKPSVSSDTHNTNLNDSMSSSGHLHDRLQRVPIPHYRQPSWPPLINEYPLSSHAARVTSDRGTRKLARHASESFSRPPQSQPQSRRFSDADRLRSRYDSLKTLQSTPPCDFRVNTSMTLESKSNNNNIDQAKWSQGPKQIDDNAYSDVSEASSPSVFAYNNSEQNSVSDSSRVSSIHKQVQGNLSQNKPTSPYWNRESGNSHHGIKDYSIHEFMAQSLNSEEKWSDPSYWMENVEGGYRSKQDSYKTYTTDSNPNTVDVYTKHSPPKAYSADTFDSNANIKTTETFIPPQYTQISKANRKRKLSILDTHDSTCDNSWPSNKGEQDAMTKGMNEDDIIVSECLQSLEQLLGMNRDRLTKTSDPFTTRMPHGNSDTKKTRIYRSTKMSGNGEEVTDTGDSSFRCFDEDYDRIISSLVEAHDNAIGKDISLRADPDMMTTLNLKNALSELQDGHCDTLNSNETTVVFPKGGPPLDQHTPRDYLQLYLNAFKKVLPTATRFFRTVPGVELLPMADRIALSKASFFEFTLLSSVGSEQDNLIGVELSRAISSGVWDTIFPDTYLAEEQPQIPQLLFKEGANLAKEEIVLLKAISLTRTDRTELLQTLHEPTKVSSLHQAFHNSLKSYLWTKLNQNRLAVEARFNDLRNTMKYLNWIGAMVERTLRNHDNHVLFLDDTSMSTPRNNTDSYFFIERGIPEKGDSSLTA